MRKILKIYFIIFIISLNLVGCSNRELTHFQNVYFKIAEVCENGNANFNIVSKYIDNEPNNTSEIKIDNEILNIYTYSEDKELLFVYLDKDKNIQIIEYNDSEDIKLTYSRFNNSVINGIKGGALSSYKSENIQKQKKEFETNR